MNQASSHEHTLRRVRHLEEQLRAVRAIGAALATNVGLDVLFQELVPNISKLMRAERTTLFVYDRSKHEIWSKVAQGTDLREIRLKVGQGIAGWVAEHQTAVNISNAYQDPRFNAEVDKRTGFHTNSVVATPFNDRSGHLLGVVQVLNHEDSAFSEDDLGLLQAIAVETAYAVENATMAQELISRNRELAIAHQRAERRRAELDVLYQLERETSGSNDVQQIIRQVLTRACERLQSAEGSLLLGDIARAQLYNFKASSTGHDFENAPVGTFAEAGSIGRVAETGEPVVSPDEASPSGNEACLAVPLIWDQRIVGAIEIRHPLPRSGEQRRGYDLEDLKLLTLIAGQVARAVSVAKERQARLDTERLASMGQMLAGVAHDLRNPMTVISGFAQLMAEEDKALERNDHCSRVLQQIDEMTAMIGDLLAFARGDKTLKPSLIDLVDLASDVRDALKTQCEMRRIQLEVAHADGTAVIDVSRAKRVIYNLARNAIEAIPRNGQLIINLKEQPKHGLSIVVKDTGHGIPQDIINRLFEPFTTSGKRDGTGLGLSIVKRFVDDHQGSIEVESANATGTTFTVVLPAAESLRD